MADYITIDGGTTNTRLRLVRDGQILDTLRYPVGARAGIDNKTLLRETIKGGITELLSRHSLGEKDICRILACGMITCEFGLLDLPHITAPAGIRELHNAMYETVLADISPIPFVFVRGVKLSTGDLASTDMMRGEETELMGICNGEAGVFILPGSHSKIITTDANGRISDFRTMLTGEMIAALSQDTILKDAVDLSISSVDPDYLRKGYDYAAEHGINEALFKVRVLKNLFGAAPQAVYSFYMGILLSDEIRTVLAKNPGKVVIGGRKAIREATAILLTALSDAEVIALTDDQVDASSALGAINVYEYAPN